MRLAEAHLPSPAVLLNRLRLRRWVCHVWAHCPYQSAGRADEPPWPALARSRVKPAVECSVKRWPPGKPRDCVGNDRACGVALGGEVRCQIDSEAMCRHVTYNGKSGDDRSAKPAAPGGSTAALFGSPPRVGRAIGTHPDSPASVLSRHSRNQCSCHSRNQCSCHNRIQCSRHNQNQCDNAPPPTLLVVLLRACSARAQHSRSAAVACSS